MAYFSSDFARPSDTFVRNEVNALRAQGVEVTTFSPRRPRVDDADEDVKRHRHDFERDEDHDEVDGGRHPHETRAGEEREGEELAETGLMRGAVDRLAHDRRVIDHHDEDENRGDEREPLEEDRHRVGAIERPEAARFGGGRR